MRNGRPRLVALVVMGAGLRLAAQNEIPLWQPPVVCFPPTAPVFGEEIADRAPPGQRSERLRPPPELADFVAETFYPALSTRLIDKTVGARLQARLDAYRALRAALLNELADQLVATNDLEDARRTAHLRLFAEQQGPRIGALEAEAEALRKDLINGGLLRRSADWSRDRPWMVGVTRFGNDVHAREAEFQVVRAAAYYQNELLLEQRGLLLEAAAELRRRARAARPNPGPKRDDASALFFSPATSRLRLPAKMPPELVEKVGRFNKLKGELTRELVEAVLRTDAADGYERPEVFKRLADRQWLQLRELEALAEEIRAVLVSLPPVKLSAPPYIPAALIKRIDTYLVERRKIMEEFNETLRAANDLMEPPKLYPWMTEEERARKLREHETQRAAMRAKVSAAFQDGAEKRIVELRAHYDRIQSELTILAEGQVDPETGRPLDADGLLRSYSVAIERFATFGREEVIYRGYRTAMLLPGLSIEQRRLLFNAALRGLAQPLPWGEAIPTGPMPVPRS